MSVLNSSLKNPSPAVSLCEADQTLRTLTIRLGKRREIDDPFLIRFGAELSRRIEGGEFREIIFDLAQILVLPSSALGLIAATSLRGAKVRIINASAHVREDFQLTGLYRIVELDPASEPPVQSP